MLNFILTILFILFDIVFASVFILANINKDEIWDRIEFKDE